MIDKSRIYYIQIARNKNKIFKRRFFMINKIISILLVSFLVVIALDYSSSSYGNTLYVYTIDGNPYYKSNACCLLSNKIIGWANKPNSYSYTGGFILPVNASCEPSSNYGHFYSSDSFNNFKFEVAEDSCYGGNIIAATGYLYINNSAVLKINNRSFDITWQYRYQNIYIKKIIKSCTWFSENYILIGEKGASDGIVFAVLDVNGNIIDNSTFLYKAVDGNYLTYLDSLLTGDGYLMILAKYLPNGENYRQFLVINLNSNGEVVFAKRYKDPAQAADFSDGVISKNSSGNYIIAFPYSATGIDKNLRIIEIDSKGQLIRNYGKEDYSQCWNPEDALGDYIIGACERNNDKAAFIFICQAPPINFKQLEITQQEAFYAMSLSPLLFVGGVGGPRIMCFSPSVLSDCGSISYYDLNGYSIEIYNEEINRDANYNVIKYGDIDFYHSTRNVTTSPNYCED